MIALINPGIWVLYQKHDKAENLSLEFPVILQALYTAVS